MSLGTDPDKLVVIADRTGGGTNFFGLRVTCGLVVRVTTEGSAEFVPPHQRIAAGLKPSTYRSYKVILQTHLKPAFANKHLAEIDRKAVREFAKAKRESIIKKTTHKVPGADESGKPPRKTSARTVQHILCCLSAIFNQAIEGRGDSRNGRRIRNYPQPGVTTSKGRGAVSVRRY